MAKKYDDKRFDLDSTSILINRKPSRLVSLENTSRDRSSRNLGEKSGLNSILLSQQNN